MEQSDGVVGRPVSALAFEEELFTCVERLESALQ